MTHIIFRPFTNSLLDKYSSDNPPVHTETMPWTEMFNLPNKQFLWQRNLNESFLNTLKLDKYQSRLLTFQETYIDPTCEGVDIATQQFTDRLSEITGNMSLDLLDPEDCKEVDCSTGSDRCLRWCGGGTLCLLGHWAYIWKQWLQPVGHFLWYPRHQLIHYRWS